MGHLSLSVLILNIDPVQSHCHRDGENNTAFDLSINLCGGGHWEAKRHSSNQNKENSKKKAAPQ